MEDVKKQAELYAESFRYKVDDGSWYEQKVRDFIAGYEAALRIHDVVGRSEQLCKHKRVIKSRLRKEDGKSKYCKDCQEWFT